MKKQSNEQAAKERLRKTVEQQSKIADRYIAKQIDRFCIAKAKEFKSDADRAGAEIKYRQDLAVEIVDRFMLLNTHEFWAAIDNDDKKTVERIKSQAKALASIIMRGSKPL
jgi:hypothetical protein